MYINLGRAFEKACDISQFRGKSVKYIQQQSNNLEKKTFLNWMKPFECDVCSATLSCSGNMKTPL